MSLKHTGDRTKADGLLKLPAERPGRPSPPDTLERRAQTAHAIEAGLWRVEGQREAVIEGVRVLKFPAIGRARGTVLHLHGGGFRLGCPDMISAFAVVLAERCKVDVVCSDYRLAPEHPFPAGLRDAYAVAHALRAADEGALIISGDSAGGGLAAGVAALFAASGQELDGLVLLSPWLDLTVTSASYGTNAATDPLFSRANALAAADLYLQGLSPEHPLASPLFGEVDGFPPTFISIGEGEVLADDGRKFHQRLRASGIVADLQSIAGMEHVAVTRDLNLPGAAETLEAVVSMIDRVLADRPQLD